MRTAADDAAEARLWAFVTAGLAGGIALVLTAPVSGGALELG